jgi:antitoxin HicB
MPIYPLSITPDDNGTFLVTFRDVPEAITVAETRDDAVGVGKQALESALAIYAEQHRPVPAPSTPQSDEICVEICIP